MVQALDAGVGEGVDETLAGPCCPVGHTDQVRVWARVWARVWVRVWARLWRALAAQWATRIK